MSTEENSFNVTGKVERIDTFTTKGGKDIHTLVIGTGGQYPQLIPIKILGRLAERIDEWHKGDVLAIAGRLGGRDWNGKVYGDNVATNVEVISEAQRELPATGNPASPPPGDDDVPF
jgi:single-stranded DNA-binding protein